MPQAHSVRPWHLLPVALLLVLWHGALAFDYINARFDLFVALPRLMDSLPLPDLWMKVVWAMAVWLGLLAGIFLLWSDDASVLLIFAASMAMVAAIAGILLAQGPVVLGGVFALVGWPCLAAGLVLVPLLGWLYARWQKRCGVLH